LAEIFWTQLAIKYVFQFPFHPTSAFALPRERRPSIVRVKMNEKSSINSIYPNVWAPTASLLQGLTDMQQCVYQIKLRNVCDVKKQLVEPGLVLSSTLSILLSMNGESICLPVFA